jgi:hypothetical protein
MEMDMEFKGLAGHNVVIYLDDVMIYSKKIDDHPYYLKQIFEICRKYDISLNPKKRVFIVLEGELLGNIISKDGISVDPKHTKSIMQIPFLNKKKSM